MSITPKEGTVVRAGQQPRPVITPKSGTVVSNAPSTMSDVARGGASGLTEGAADLAGLPSTISGAATDAAGWLLGMEVPQVARDAVKSGIGMMMPGLGGMPDSETLKAQVSDATGGYTDYDPQTFAGKAAKNVGYMVPGAVAVGATGGASALPGALMYGAAVPGVAGVAAEEVATPLARSIGLQNPEMYGKGAKFAAEMLSPGIAQKAAGATRIGMEAHAVQNVDDMVAAGLVKPTVGQMTRNPDLLAREAGSMGFAEKMAAQSKSMMDYAYGKIGWNSKIPPNAQQLDDLGSTIGQSIEQHISGVQYPIYAQDRNVATSREMLRNLSGADDSSKNLIQMWLGDLSGNSHLTAADINKIRSDAWELSVSPNANRASKDAAITVGKLADSMIERTLSEAAHMGVVSPDTYSNYLKSRKDYANYLAVRGAIEASGRPSAMVFGVDDLARSAAKIPGVSDDFRSMIGHAATYYVGHPSIPKKTIMQRVEGMGQDLASVAMIGTLSPGAATAQAVATGVAGVGKALHPLTMTGVGQKMLERGAGAQRGNILMNPYQTGAIMGAASEYPQEERAQRKAGGRISVDHEAAADRLVRDAERAKQGISKTTEGMLNMPDEQIVKALSIAKRNIE